MLAARAPGASSPVRALVVLLLLPWSTLIHNHKGARPSFSEGCQCFGVLSVCVIRLCPPTKLRRARHACCRYTRCAPPPPPPQMRSVSIHEICIYTPTRPTAHLHQRACSVRWHRRRPWLSTRQCSTAASGTPTDPPLVARHFFRCRQLVCEFSYRTVFGQPCRGGVDTELRA
jgi:hypothetical protein